MERLDETAVNGSVERDGQISSPGWPKNYVKGDDCAWHLQAPRGHTVVLELTHFVMRNKQFAAQKIDFDVNNKTSAISNTVKPPISPHSNSTPS